MTPNPNETLLPEPVYPEEWACCNSGCGENCVYDIYRREKADYDAQQKRLREAENEKTND